MVQIPRFLYFSHTSTICTEAPRLLLPAIVNGFSNLPLSSEIHSRF